MVSQIDVLLTGASNLAGVVIEASCAKSKSASVANVAESVVREPSNAESVGFCVVGHDGQIAASHEVAMVKAWGAVLLLIVSGTKEMAQFMSKNLCRVEMVFVS